VGLVHAAAAVQPREGALLEADVPRADEGRAARAVP